MTIIKHHDVDWVFAFHQHQYILLGESKSVVILWVQHLIQAEIFLFSEKPKHIQLDMFEFVQKICSIAFLSSLIKIGHLLSCMRNTKCHYAVIIMSCRQHRYPWPSLATSPYHSSPLAGLQGYILCPHIAAVCKFELVVLLLLSHMWGYSNTPMSQAMNLIDWQRSLSTIAGISPTNFWVLFLSEQLEWGFWASLSL